MKYKKVIDISTFDRSVDFKKVKAAGYAGVIIRAGYGQTNVDAYYHEHIQGALKSGLPVGVYWFSYAYKVEMAKKEAEKCIKLLKKYKISMPVFWDFEYDSDRYAKSQGHPVSNLTLDQMAVAFCSGIRKAGYVPGIYFNKDYRDSRFDRKILDSYVQWYAYYNKTLDSGADQVDLWQYTSKGDVPGISAPDEDLNYLINEKIIFTSSAQKTVEESEAEKYTRTLQVAIKTSYGLKISVSGQYDDMTDAAVRIYYLYYTNPTIKNAHVSWLQEALRRLGYKLTVDGSYGPETMRTVKQFQEDYKLIIDGWAGPNTHRKIIEVMKEVIG